MYIGFQLSAERFFIFWLVVMLTDMAALSVVFFLSAGMRDAAIASLLIGVAFAVSAVSTRTVCISCLPFIHTFYMYVVVWRSVYCTGLFAGVGQLDQVSQFYPLWR